MNVEALIKTKTKVPIGSRTIIHLTMVSNKINESITTVLKPYEVSLQQFNVLRILRGQKGTPANLSTLNERMVTKMSNTTRLVDKLISKGLVKRNICETNRRKVEIFITEKGLKTLSKMDKAVTKAENEIIAGFSENELKQLNAVLDKF
jgi:DNA-binding MarR family transcriptional regulator